MPKPNLKAVALKALAQEGAPTGEHYVARLKRDEGFKVIPRNLIRPNPDQPRKHFDEKALAELATSIKDKGILVPLLVRPAPDGAGFIIVGGERRWRAAGMAKLAELPAIIRPHADHEEVALIDNAQRENLTPLEFAHALFRLKERKHYKLEDLALVIGKSKATVSEALRLLELPEDIQAEIGKSSDVRTFGKSQLLQVVRAGDPQKVRATWEALREGEAPTVRALRERTKTPKGRPKHFVFSYIPEHERFRVTVTFSKVRVTHDEVKDALKEAAKHQAP